VRRLAASRALTKSLYLDECSFFMMGDLISVGDAGRIK
jgi:hypothetical protein